MSKLFLVITNKKMMMKNIFFYLLILILIFQTPLLKAALFIPFGSEILYLGSSASAVSLGGAFTSDNDIQDNFVDNPTKAALIQHPTFFSSYLGFNNISSSYLFGYSKPTDYGVFSIVYHQVNGNRFDLKKFQSTQIAFSKKIFPNYHVGFKFNSEVALIKANSDESETMLSGFHGDVNLIYIGNNQQFGLLLLQNIHYGVQIKNIGLVPFYINDLNQTNFIRALETRLGISFDVLKFENFATRIYTDLTYYPLNEHFNFNLGLKTSYQIPMPIIKQITLQAGFIPNTKRYGIKNIGPFTAGLSLFFDFKYLSPSLNYAILPRRDNNNDHHLLSFQLKFKQKGHNKPQINTKEDFGQEGIIENTIINE